MKDQPAGLSEPPDAEEVTTEVGERRVHVPDLLARGLLTLLLIGLIAWILLSNVSDLESVGEALSSVSTEAGILLVVLLLVVQLLVGLQLAFTVPGIGMPRAVVAVESASAVSNTIPGPSGTATRLAILRSWGYYTDDFARSWLFTSTLTNAAVLVMPVVAVLIMLAEGEFSTGVLVLALIALAVSVAGVVIIWLMVRRETFAYSLGEKVGGVVRWARGVTRRRPSAHDFAEAAVRFRDGLLDLWSRNGGRVVAAVIAVYVGNAAILAVSMRSVGLDTAVLPIGSVFVVYAVVRVLTIVNITPGGVGVVEALYTGAFLIVTDNQDQSEIVAGVLLFRGLTYVGPILLGAVSLLIWRMRGSWRVAAPPEPVGAAAVGAVLTDREPPGD